MQFKIPQEINVEDKVVGPFTLKSFGFLFVFFAIGAFFTVTLKGFGVSFVGSMIIGALLGSPLLALGFVPFNGKPLYTYVGSFVTYLFKPRKRVWKKYVEPVKKPLSEEDNVEKIDIDLPPQKANIADAQKRIEELSLMVDTGGAYGMKNEGEAPETFLEKDNVTIEKALEQADKKKPTQSSEPSVSELASIDPKKKFEYDNPDTSSYKVNEIINHDRQNQKQ